MNTSETRKVDLAIYTISLNLHSLIEVKRARAHYLAPIFHYTAFCAYRLYLDSM